MLTPRGNRLPFHFAILRNIPALFLKISIILILKAIFNLIIGESGYTFF
jgi:hypothetical protein